MTSCCGAEQQEWLKLSTEAADGADIDPECLKMRLKYLHFLKPPPNTTYFTTAMLYAKMLSSLTTSVLKARLNVCRPRLTDYHVMPLSDLWWLFSLHPVGPFRTSINIFPSDMVGRKCSSKKKKKNVFVLSLTAHYSQRHLSFPRAKATSKPFFCCFFFTGCSLSETVHLMCWCVRCGDEWIQVFKQKSGIWV